MEKNGSSTQLNPLKLSHVSSKPSKFQKRIQSNREDKLQEHNENKNSLLLDQNQSSQMLL